MDTEDFGSPPHLWFGIASVWLGVGLVNAAQTVFIMRAEGMHHAWVKVFVTTVLFWLPWALATGPVIRLSHRFPPRDWRSPGGAAAHLGACSTIGLLFTAWTTWLERSLNLYGGDSTHGPFARIWLDKFFGDILSSLLLYTGILTVTYLMESRAHLAQQQTETARLNEQLSKAQLDALRKQIEPHFLFNTLNAIAGLVRGGSNEAAVTMIAGLSEFLRRTLQDSAHQQVPLEEELEFTQKYLAIQSVRFADRLRLSVDVPVELYPAQVPSLILQPIVENAVKHGIAKRVQGGMIRIAAFQFNGTLTLVVFNDGPSLPETGCDGSGIGSANVRTRLTGLYGKAFSYSMRNADGGGVEVSISLPYVVSTHLSKEW